MDVRFLVALYPVDTALQRSRFNQALIAIYILGIPWILTSLWCLCGNLNTFERTERKSMIISETRTNLIASCLSTLTNQSVTIINQSLSNLHCNDRKCTWAIIPALSDLFFRLRLAAPILVEHNQWLNVFNADELDSMQHISNCSTQQLI